MQPEVNGPLLLHLAPTTSITAFRSVCSTNSTPVALAVLVPNDIPMVVMTSRAPLAGHDAIPKVLQ